MGSQQTKPAVEMNKIYMYFCISGIPAIKKQNKLTQFSLEDDNSLIIPLSVMEESSSSVSVGPAVPGLAELWTHLALMFFLNSFVFLPDCIPHSLCSN